MPPASRRDLLTGNVSGTTPNADGLQPDPAMQAILLNACETDPAPKPSLEQHATQRLMYGPLPGDVANVQAMGYENWLSQQLQPWTIDDSAAEAFLATIPSETFSESWAQLYDRRNMTYSESVKPFNQVRHHTFARAIHSKKQLYERMVDFWHTHFSVYGLDSPPRSLFPKWDQTIRQHALGNYRNMLMATAKNPVMLYYLDNYLSTDGGPNENYARELFELHTLGIENYQVQDGYVDLDVYESSRAFTGWTYERESNTTDPDYVNRGQFKYVHEDHDRFQKRVLGVNLPNDQPPLKDGEDVINIIAYSPATARHIARKLCQRFVADNPPQSLVDSTALVFMQNAANDFQMISVMAHILTSAEFKDPQYRANKFKRPFEWVVSAFRAWGLEYKTTDAFQWLYAPIGQPIFEWRPPDGPPDDRESWATSNGLLRRWNMAFQISSFWYDDYGLVIPTSQMPNYQVTPRQVAMFWADRCIGRPWSTATEGAMIDFVAEGRSENLAMSTSQINNKVSHVAALATMTPEFQWR